MVFDNMYSTGIKEKYIKSYCNCNSLINLIVIFVEADFRATLTSRDGEFSPTGVISVISVGQYVTTVFSFC